MAGVLSFLLVDLPALIAAVPRPEGVPMPELPNPVILKLASIAQPAVLISLAILVGVFIAGKIGLHSPVAEAIASRSSFWPALRPQVLPGIIFGFAGGIAIVLAWVIAKPSLPTEFVTQAQRFNSFLPPAVRILYGGFTEELLLRWGVMTLIVWASWRLIGRGRAQPGFGYFVFGILASSVIFGLGHLPIASVLAGGLTASIVIYVITANSLFGIVAGFLYWRLGLESAILAHMCAHLVLIAAIQLSL